MTESITLPDSVFLLRDLSKYVSHGEGIWFHTDRLDPRHQVQVSDHPSQAGSLDDLEAAMVLATLAPAAHISLSRFLFFLRGERYAQRVYGILQILPQNRFRFHSGLLGIISHAPCQSLADRMHVSC